MKYSLINKTLIKVLYSFRIREVLDLLKPSNNNIKVNNI